VTAMSSLRLVRVFPAPRERVFRAWTDPDELRRWWGPGLFSTPRAHVDLRPGGRYELVMQPPVGEPLILAGTFLEITAPERLVYTWRWESGVPEPRESLVTVEFRDRGGATEVVLIHRDLPAGPAAEPYREGWESGLDKLGEALAAGSPADRAVNSPD